MRIELDEQTWRQVLACLAKSPWEVANPLIMAIGAQMQAQQQSPQMQPVANRGNSGGVGHPDVDVEH
jgi:hypothetical protein